MSTKECPKCIEEININASICPNCQSPQNIFERYFVKPNFFSTLFLALIFLFIYVDMESDKNIYDKHSVEIIVLSHSTIETDRGKGIAVFVKVKNISDVALHHFYFDIEVFSKTGELKEAFSDSVYGLSILPDQTKTIELSRTMVSTEESEYDFTIQLSKASTRL
ncbi:MAG: hypothetical protein COA86_17525 [Kangiella sp.]|nr:MAG: hypothetical protein COA86_17525 [Kangiella sp.]